MNQRVLQDQKFQISKKKTGGKLLLFSYCFCYQLPKPLVFKPQNVIITYLKTKILNVPHGLKNPPANMD